MKKFIYAVLALVMSTASSYAAEGESLRIINKDTAYTVSTPDGDVTIGFDRFVVCLDVRNGRLGFGRDAPSYRDEC